MPTAAIVGAGIGAAGSLGSGLLGYFGAQKAADAQSQAAQQALEAQKAALAQGQGDLRNVLTQQQGLYGSTQGMLSPYLGLGQDAAGAIGKLYGFGGQGAGQGGGQPDYSQFYQSPDYGFAFDQGRRATQNMLSAQGNLLSGGGMAALTNYGQGMASQQYGNYFNRLLSLTGIGQQAAGQGMNNALGFANAFGNTGSNMANLTVGATNNMANTMQGIGQAQASGYVGGANALGGALTGVGSAANQGIMNYGMLNYLNKLQPSSGSAYGASGWPSGGSTSAVPYQGTQSLWGAG